MLLQRGLFCLFICFLFCLFVFVGFCFCFCVCAKKVCAYVCVCIYYYICIVHIYNTTILVRCFSYMLCDVSFAHTTFALTTFFLLMFSSLHITTYTHIYITYNNNNNNNIDNICTAKPFVHWFAKVNSAMSSILFLKDTSFACLMVQTELFRKVSFVERERERERERVWERERERVREWDRERDRAWRFHARHFFCCFGYNASFFVFCYYIN